MATEDAEKGAGRWGSTRRRQRASPGASARSTPSGTVATPAPGSGPGVGTAGFWSPPRRVPRGGIRVMSRGLGWRQRRVVDLLSADEQARSEGLPLSALRPALGKDRSNARRAIDSLVGQGKAGWVTCPKTGERRLKLELWTCVAAVMNRAEAESCEPDPFEEAQEHRREVEAAVDAIRSEAAQKRRALQEAEALWEEPGRSLERRRYPGPNQLRVIAVLVRYADDPRLGLPVRAVRRIVCAGGAVEKANVLRAVRTLTRRGTLQRSKDGDRLRLTAWMIPWRWDYAQYALDPAQDDAKAEAVLEGFGEAAGVSRRGETPWLAKRFPEGR